MLWPKYQWAASSIWSFINSSWICSPVPLEQIAHCSCWLGCDWCAAAFWLLYSPLPRNHQNSPRELSSTHSKASGRRTPTNQTQLPACTGSFSTVGWVKGPVFYISAKIQTKLLPGFACIVCLASTSDTETFTEENCLYLDQTSRSRWSKHENYLFIYSLLHYLSSCWGSHENNIIKWNIWWTDINLKKKEMFLWQITE